MAVPQRMDRRRRPACAHPRRPRFRCARVGAKPDIELQSFRGKPTDAPRSCNVSGIFGIERLQPRGSESAFAGRYPCRYHRHHPRAISIPLARPPLFRLPISRHSEGGIRRRRHLLEHIDATMELAHPAGADSLPPQPSQLASAVACQFAQSRWPSPGESEWHLGCQKDQKSAREHALPAQVIGRVDGELSDRTTMVQGEQPAASAYDRTIGQAPSIGGAMCPLHRKRQTSVNA